MLSYQSFSVFPRIKTFPLEESFPYLTKYDKSHLSEGKYLNLFFNTSVLPVALILLVREY